MTETSSSQTQRPTEGRHLATPLVDETVDRTLERRAALRSRHAQSLTRLMEERNDLRGVHALADFVDDAVRWTA